MKKEVHKTYIRFLRTKKYKIWDFLGPLLVLPFAYGVLLMPDGLDKIEMITWLILVFVYAPIAYFIITRRRK